MISLPIEEALPSLRNALGRGPAALVVAPPGAGKSTLVPLALLDESWMAGQKLLMLEPRRLATRAVAQRMASLLGEQVGDTVGYRMRFDTHVGPRTRIEVVTEGVLTRLLQASPDLHGYGAVLFDEFHERSLQADVGLALTLEAQRLFRPDLRIVVMSATIETGPLRELLGNAPTIRSEGKLYPVDTRYLDCSMTGPFDTVVAHTIRRSLAHEHGSLLVFLPGMADIRRVERRLLDSNLSSDIFVVPLHGDLPQSAQDAAIRPAPPGKRKVVLATSIAETSLTIEGIRVVIDTGWMRVPRFDPRTGLTRLETIRVTQDSADQRRGRAGRTEPGICYRLWTEQEHQRLSPRRPPEILEADLAPLLLDLALWGSGDPSELLWLTPPPPGAVSQAKELLSRLGALNANGRITIHGKRMAELPLHPRLSHMLIRSEQVGCIDLACTLAALLSERDVVHGPSTRGQADLRLRLDVLHGCGSHAVSASIDQRVIRHIRRVADMLRKHLGEGSGHADVGVGLKDERAVGLLLALAYPDRIAQRQSGPTAHYLLPNGRGARFVHPDPLASAPYLVIASLSDGSPWASIELAAPIDQADIESLLQDQITETQTVIWNERAQAVTATRQRKFGALVLTEQRLPNPDPSLVTEALIERLQQVGLSSLAWTPELKQWRARVQWLKRIEGNDSAWPDLSDETLLRTLGRWLGPFINGFTTLERVQRLDLTLPLRALLSYEQQRDLDRLAPTHLTVPSGSKVRIDYETSDCPILAVQIQELFGCKETPRIAGGKMPLMIHLLSPAKRPVHITQDLAGFWARGYQAVRKELRGRYPKHHWPDDPLTATPTTKTKRQSRS
ncbi:MAG: ATP-dependent helicase HrpB [Nitrospira sp.]|nr:ATP-dependent helicase HrpB [Nitrospira sp.]MCP9442587.1 ATP-dependent helicase HrpB [Nitrospira sp.]